MAQQLSPKQYIQTKARTLPVYKSFVNKDWEEAHMAQVIVMRRHVNGNVTTGIYLVDLLCLGVKDAAYFFNEPETELEERFGDDFNAMFMQVDYTLAHNIVYAGHDFALEYDIRPHADFAIAKLILEEDDDAIELVEIEVGHEGKPHLVVRQAGQNSDALAKLRKNAGEGNYFYTIGENLDEEEGDEYDDDDEYEDDDEGEADEETSDSFEFGEDAESDDEFDGNELDEDEEEGDDDDNEAWKLEDIKIGELDVLDARYIDDEDIFNEHEVSEREEDEKLTINVEAGIRALRIGKPELLEYEYEIDDVTGAFVVGLGYETEITEEHATEFTQVMDEFIAFYNNAPADANEEAMKLAMLEKHTENPLVVTMVFENSAFDVDPSLYIKAKAYMQALAPAYVRIALSLALVALIKQDDTDLYLPVYNSSDIADAFPGKKGFDAEGANTYCLIQTLVSIRDKDLASAVYYYYLAADTDAFSNLLQYVQAELLNAIGGELGLDKGEDDVKPTLRIV